jgi:hypothetical protein
MVGITLFALYAAASKGHQVSSTFGWAAILLPILLTRG